MPKARFIKKYPFELNFNQTIFTWVWDLGWDGTFRTFLASQNRYFKLVEWYCVVCVWQGILYGAHDRVVRLNRAPQISKIKNFKMS